MKKIKTKRKQIIASKLKNICWYRRWASYPGNVSCLQFAPSKQINKQQKQIKAETKLKTWVLSMSRTKSSKLMFLSFYNDYSFWVFPPPEKCLSPSSPKIMMHHYWCFTFSRVLLPYQHFPPPHVWGLIWGMQRTSNWDQRFHEKEAKLCFIWKSSPPHYYHVALPESHAKSTVESLSHFP